jgi:membrane-associated protease RseP (regulator of RpoE activity)
VSAAFIVVFFLMLLVIILIHEGGHYLTARAFGFRVLEYYVGFGPQLWSFRRGEIDYGVKALPLGGYVKIAGMNPFENDVPPGDEDRAYTAKPIWQRAIVILAGPLSHFLVAVLIFAALLFVVGDRHVAKIGSVESQLDGRAAPAAQAGIQPGDVVIAMGTVQHPTGDDIGPYMASHPGEPIPFTIQRDDTTQSVTLTPVRTTIEGVEGWRIGVTLVPVPRTLPSAAVGGVGLVWAFSKESVGQIGHVFGPHGVSRLFTLLFTDAPRDQGDAASVVGVGQQVGAIGSTGDWAYLFYLFGYVTLFIGLINLVPLPPFDGGHLAILVIEKLRHRTVDMRKVVPVSAIVLAFLAVFVLSTMLLDIWKPIPISP